MDTAVRFTSQATVSTPAWLTQKMSQKLCKALNACRSFLSTGKKPGRMKAACESVQALSDVPAAEQRLLHAEQRRIPTASSFLVQQGLELWYLLKTKKPKRNTFPNYIGRRFRPFHTAVCRYEASLIHMVGQVFLATPGFLWAAPNAVLARATWLCQTHVDAAMGTSITSEASQTKICTALLELSAAEQQLLAAADAAFIDENPPGGARPRAYRRQAHAADMSADIFALGLHQDGVQSTAVGSVLKNMRDSILRMM